MELFLELPELFDALALLPDAEPDPFVPLALLPDAEPDPDSLSPDAEELPVSVDFTTGELV